MGDDFDNLIDSEENNQHSYSSLDSVISVINDEGEEEIIDLYEFYREKSTRRKKSDVSETQPDFDETPISTAFRKRKESHSSVKSDSTPKLQDIEESTETPTYGDLINNSYFRDHHILRALEIQAKAQERYNSQNEEVGFNKNIS